MSKLKVYFQIYSLAVMFALATSFILIMIYAINHNGTIYITFTQYNEYYLEMAMSFVAFFGFAPVMASAMKQLRREYNADNKP